MAAQLGREMRLMQQVSVARLLSDVTAFGAADLAESKTDGGWLYCSTADGQGVVAPADARLFQSDHDLMLLRRMFEGVDDAVSAPTQFEKVYRPCRIRSKQPPDRYEIVQKGLLQFAGQPRPPAPAPPSYYSLRLEIQGSSMQAPSTLVSVVAAQIRALARRLEDIEGTLDSLSTRSTAAIPVSQIADLENRLRQGIREEIRQTEARLTEQFKTQIAAAAPQPPTELGVTKVRVEALIKRVARMEKDLKTVFSKTASSDWNPAEEPRSADKAPVPAARPAAETRAVTATGRPAIAEQPPVEQPLAAAPPRSAALPVPPLVSMPQPQAPAILATTGEQPPAEDEGLPKGWQQVVGSLVAFNGLDEKELCESLLRMKAALEGLSGQTEIRIVHPMFMGASGRFRVHDVVTNQPGQVVCQVCGDSRTHQAVVCAGKEGAAKLEVLFAPGDYAPYNYPAGYQQLIQNSPNMQFRMETIKGPAVLTLVPGSSPAEYTVLHKLQWEVKSVVS